MKALFDFALVTGSSDLAFIGCIILQSFSEHKTCKSAWATFAWYTLGNANAGSTVIFKHQFKKYLIKKYFLIAKRAFGKLSTPTILKRMGVQFKKSTLATSPNIKLIKSINRSF